MQTESKVTFLFVLLAALTSSFVRAQDRLDFDFGQATGRAGHKSVQVNTIYSREIGYGFEPGAAPRESASSRRGYLASDAPFFFSVKLAEGNYRIRVTLEDAGGSVTTIKAELRRLMIENVRLSSGESRKVSFTVNVRTPSLPDGGEVKLKDRERTTELWAWDEKLTLEFNGVKPAISALEITKVDIPTIFLLGDSTVCDQPREPYNSWGQMLTRFVDPRMAIANHAESGESLKSSLAARRFDKVYAVMKPGDYVFLQFGHNDQKERGDGVGAHTTYKADLERTVDAIKRRQGNPVLITSMNRRSFGADGKITNSLGEYPAAVRAVAAEKQVPLIDLNESSRQLYEALGPDRSEILFKPGDGTHHSNYGSYQLSKCIAVQISRLNLPLARYLAADIKAYNPQSPDSYTAFSIPPSPQTTEIRPLGN